MRVQKRYKLVSRESHPANSVVERRWRGGRRREVFDHGRAVLGRKRRATPDHRARRESGGRHDPARRRLQAAHLALRIPGTRQGRPASARSSRSRKPGSKSSPKCSASARRACRGSRRHPANRRAQCAEFPAPHRVRADGQADPAQARPERAHRRMAARRRIHPGAWQSERALLRARHPHLRDLHAQHARSRRRGDRRKRNRTCP